MVTQAVRFTKAKLEAIQPPSMKEGATGSVYDSYKDTEEKGLQLLVSHSGSKVFYLYKKIQGRPQRIRLGSFPDISIEQARKKATQAKSQIAEGTNPNEEKKRLRADISFGDYFVHHYLEEHAKPNKKSWQQDEKLNRLYLAKLQTRKMSSISKDEIEKLHRSLTQDKGAYSANRVLALVSTVYNRAIEKGWHGVNPVQGIKKNKEKSRDRFVQGDELQRFFAAVAEVPNELMRDYFLISLFCGQRRSNIMAMRWDQIDFKLKFWYIPDTKSGDPHTVVLIDPALEILQRRKRNAESEWVFPSDVSASGHLEEPKRSWQSLLKRAQIENLRIHDLRRTLGSYQAITGASLPIIGKSLGHKSINATAIYARLQNDPVRASMDAAAKAMLEHTAK
jgi:integrase